MYNNVGILTTRGTGTSGHVQSNRFNARPRPGGDRGRGGGGPPPPRTRRPNCEILEHDRRRAVEVALAELADQLEEEG
jgi:serine/arginine repetitive matrix protein 2